MSTLRGTGGGVHDITVSLAADVITALPHGRMQHRVDWPHLWQPGDHVSVMSSDGQRYLGMVLDVSYATRAVLIELDHAD